MSIYGIPAIFSAVDFFRVVAYVDAAVFLNVYFYPQSAFVLSYARDKEHMASAKTAQAVNAVKNFFMLFSPLKI